MLTRAELGLGPGDFAVLSVGDLNRNKNHGVLVEALPSLPANVRLLVAGEGPLRAELARRAEALGVAGRVSLLGFRSDVPALLNACDLFCMPSLREGLPVSLMEAAATGTPCLASGARGCADVLGELAEECIVCEGTPAAWASAIGRMLDPAARARVGEALLGRSSAFSLSEAVRQAASVYVRALGGGTSRIGEALSCA